MKNKLFILFLFVVSLFYAQNTSNIEINGKIIVESEDLFGITIYNKTLNKTAVTNEKGAFDILVGLNNDIEVKAMQYKNVKFTINQDILDSKTLKIFLIEEASKLDEIVVYSKGLTGNLKTDINAKQTFKPKLDVLYFGKKSNNNAAVLSKPKLKNTAMDLHGGPEYVNGLNIVSVVDQLLLPLFRSKVENKKQVGIPAVPERTIKYYLGSEFLVDNFNIPEHKIEAFIRYVEASDFDFNLLNYGHEMEFIQLLSQKSKAFLNQ